ncbi:hypothetical protein XENORESO_002261 [Xenotaenia resolanae]|uniref:DUF3456 domain-containing protein n=1 Tax=Xenotaenia resolanae TaxID=208358 RepID=A0ABV0W329_9TELE
MLRLGHLTYFDLSRHHCLPFLFQETSGGRGPWWSCGEADRQCLTTFVALRIILCDPRLRFKNGTNITESNRHLVPFARSETHLSELLDGVCNSMNDYALYVDPETHHKQYRRFAPRSSGSSENFPDFKNFQFDGPEASNNLKFACETLVEELEDDIISLLGQDEGNVQEELCNRVSDYCEDDSQPNDEL